MRKNITYKLTSYFVMALFIFVLIISVLFFTFYRKTMLDTYTDELTTRAIRIAEALSSVDRQTTGGHGSNNSYGAYIRFINDIAMTDVWVVDEDLNIISYGMNAQHHLATTSDLPENATKIVDDVFSGQIESSREFSSLFTTPTITIGVPITTSHNTIVGVVLLHSPVNGIDDAFNNTAIIMFLSIIFALSIAVMLAGYLARVFTKPLKSLNQTTLHLIDEDFIQTDIKQADEIGTLANSINILSDRLKRSSEQQKLVDKMRKDFLANISHELKTPITVIKGSLETLNDGMITEKAMIKSYYLQMIKDCDHLERLVSDLLDLSKLQNPDFSLNITTIDLIDVINESIKSTRLLASQKNINIKLNNDLDYLKIDGDFYRLKQMIIIIIDNAIKFSEANSAIAITLDNTDKTKLIIQDHGIGIAEEELPFIFDRFHKVDKTNHMGSGLGLTIAKQIASRHNIDVDVTSKVAHGTTFTFTFNDR